MSLEVISKQALLKGLDVVGTGDALHSAWLREIQGLNPYSDGIYEKNGCKFIITLEVEDMHRVHHLIFLPGIDPALGLREEFLKHSVDIDKDGRPHLRLNGEEIVDHVKDAGGILGPSHAFVPWTSVYKEYDSLRACYGDNYKDLSFIELGLSADTEMADYIPELQDLTFLSNSDAHSPWPHRLGREFNRLEVGSLSFDEIRKALERKSGNRVTLNVGFDPRLGKYHRTACIRCYTLYEFEDAKKLRWRCAKCKGVLKKGVRDRITELGAYPAPRHPEHRPQYIRIAPLAEILCLALNVKSLYSAKVQESWKKLVGRFGSEIAVLIDVDVEDLKKEINERTGELIEAFRSGNFNITQGGGGKYGEIIFDRPSKEKFYTGKQGSLDQYLG
jgi:uncharacterized protein (TIGR00375 family)